MFVLDTNHFRELVHASEIGLRLKARISLGGEFVLSIVTAEETLRGWLARIAMERDVAAQAFGYFQLSQAIQALSEYVLLPWDEDAALRFKRLRAAGIRIGTMDLKIACIAMEHDAVLLTRNRTDFEKVPGLLFENWLD